MFSAINVLIAFVTAVLLTYVVRRKPKNYPPGPLSLPFIGNLHQLGRKPFVTFMEMRKKYGGIFAIDFASIRAVVITDYKILREALAMPEFSGRARFRPFLERCGGSPAGIIMNDGPSWVDHRRFSLRNLRDLGFGKKTMEALLQDEAEELVTTFKKLNGQPFKTKYFFHVAVLNSIWWIVFGKRFAHDDEEVLRIAKMLADGLGVSPAAGAFFFFPWLTRLFPGWTGYNSFLNFQLESSKYIQQQYAEARKTFKSGEQRHFVDVCIQQVADCDDPKSSFYGPVGDRHMCESVCDLFMAGMETSSTTMSSAVMLLALHPPIQERLFQEIKSVVGLTAPPKLDDAIKMPYYEAMITEVMRLSSIIPLSFFHRVTEDVTFQGYQIPKNTIFVPNLYGAHHDKEAWGDPENFRPERFLKEDGSLGKTREEFLAFSYGKRLCLGETIARHLMFMYLVNIFQKFQFLPNPDKPTPVVAFSPTCVIMPIQYEWVLKPRV